MKIATSSHTAAEKEAIAATAVEALRQFPVFVPSELFEVEVRLQEVTLQGVL